jgi:hypothetical protein
MVLGKTMGIRMLSDGVGDGYPANAEWTARVESGWVLIEVNGGLGAEQVTVAWPLIHRWRRLKLIG